jgi:hypothetical protein
MEGLSSAESLAASSAARPLRSTSSLYAKAHRVRRRLSSLHHRKRARLQPRPRTASMSPSSTQLDHTTGEAGRTGATPAADISSVPDAARPRHPTVQSDINDAILYPGTVRINVQGAFIVDDDPVTPRSDDYEHDPRDIRLPNHTSVVSHVAVDVSCPPSPAADVARDLRPAIAPRPSGRMEHTLTEHSMCRLAAHSPNSYTSPANPTKDL